jgi:hypothetical protein
MHSNVFNVSNTEPSALMRADFGEMEETGKKVGVKGVKVRASGKQPVGIDICRKLLT